MAKRKDGKEKPADKLTFAVLTKVWTDLTVTDWFLLISDLHPESKFKQHGTHIKGKCPFHNDPTPSFIVTPHKGVVKCFGCQKVYHDPVQFVADMRTSPSEFCGKGDALLLLRSRFGLKTTIPEDLYEAVQAYATQQRLKSTLQQFFGALLFEGIAAYPDLKPIRLAETKTAVEYLMQRNLGGNAPNELIAVKDTDAEGPACPADPYSIWATLCSSQLIGVFPSVATVANHFGADSPECKFFCEYFAEILKDPNHLGDLVFPMHDDADSISRFKLRRPSTESKNMLFVADPYEAETGGYRGFYGLHHARMFLGPQSVDGNSYVDSALFMEGEFDVLACIAQQVRRQSDDFVVLAMGGASVQPLDKVLTYGISNINIVQDGDRGGNTLVKRCLDITRTDKVNVKIFSWPEEYKNWRDSSDLEKRVKDPDEAIKALGYPKFARYVRTASNFRALHEWCFEQAAYKISKQEANDVGQKSREAIEWGKLILNSHECLAFCEAISRHYSLDKGLLFRDIRAQEEDEEAFVVRLCQCLPEHFHFIGVQNIENRKRLLSVWHKGERTIDSVVLNDDRAIETMFSRYFGTLYSFIREHVGDPGFMAPEAEVAPMNIMARNKRYREYLNLALLRLAQGLPSIDHAPVKAQGIHYTGKDAEGVNHSYMVNGRDVFHMMHKGDDGEEFSANRLEGPSHRGIIFENSGPTWLESVTVPEDLTTGRVNIAKLFLNLCDMIGTGWSWRHLKHDHIFLAAYNMCIPVMTVFSRQTAIMINAEASSGKSRFTSGFIGGTSFGRIHVQAHAIAMQGYTAASIRSQRNNSSLALCLEEFEDYGTNDPKSLAVRRVLELTRDIIGEKPVRWSIGTASGHSITFEIRFPLIACAINPLRDTASLSRFVNFELTHDPKRIDPVIALLEKFGDAGIKETRHQLAVGLIPHMVRLRFHQANVEREYATGAMMPMHASSRFRESLYPIISMLRLIEEEAKKEGITLPPELESRRFAYEFADTRKDQQARIKSNSANEHIFESVLSSAIQIESKGHGIVSGVTTIRAMLNDMNNLNEINRTKKGVYIDVRQEWILVNWIEAAQGVLANTKYKLEAPTFLKQVSERSPYFVKTEDVKAAQSLERLVDVMGPCHTLDLISVFSVKHLLEGVRKHQASGVNNSGNGSGGSNGSNGTNGAVHAEPKHLTSLPVDLDMPQKIDDDIIT